MSHELWATYSVKDHLQPRALAADIMIFDRLVFPVPETAEFPPNSGPPDKNGPVEWKRNPIEWARWEEERHWDPAGQQELLKLLQPIVRKVAWQNRGSQYDLYRKESAKLAAQGVPDYAFVATRTAMTRDLPAYVTGVAALGPAYRTIEEIERELGIGSPGATRRLPGGALPTVLAWEFFAPDPDDQMPTEKLLTETVDFVTGDGEFRKRRTAFNEWQQTFLRDGTTDRESIDRAVEQMRELLEAAKTAATKLKVRKIARYAFRVAPSALGLAAAFAGIPGGVEMAAGGCFLSLGGIGVDELVFKSAEQGAPPPTAFVHDARRHFGWKE